MRCIGQLQPEDAAIFFSDFLTAQGIENETEMHPDGRCSIWVIQEDRVPSARGLLERFQTDPGDPVFQPERVKEGLKQQKAREAASASSRSRVYSREQLWAQSSSGWLTMVLLALSVGCTAALFLQPESPLVKALYIGEHVALPGIPWWQGLVEIQHGQIWRLVTPIFLHFSILHILFNMMWLRDLGGMVEQRKGPWWLGAMVLVIAVASNLAQYAVSGPSFGGMSGVVYGLLGYVWMMGKYAPESGLRLHSSTVFLMMAWFALGLFGALGHVANTVHAVGLGVGVAWGWLAGKGWR